MMDRERLHEDLWEEYKLVQTAIDRQDHWLFMIKAWCITAWTGILSWYFKGSDGGAGEKGLRTGLVLAAGVVFAVWVFDAFRNQVLGRLLGRSKTIECDINQLPVRAPASIKVPWISHEIGRERRKPQECRTLRECMTRLCECVAHFCKCAVELFCGTPRVWELYWSLLFLTGLLSIWKAENCAVAIIAPAAVAGFLLVSLQLVIWGALYCKLEWIHFVLFVGIPLLGLCFCTIGRDMCGCTIDLTPCRAAGIFTALALGLSYELFTGADRLEEKRRVCQKHC